MNQTSKIDEAIRFAVERHSGQFDAAGRPFIFHPLDVGARLATQRCDEAVVIAGILHDTVEDTETTIEEIRERFGERVAALVAAETHRKGHQTYREYIVQVASAGLDAIDLKLADLDSNSDVGRVDDAVYVNGQPMAEWHAGMVRDRYVPARAVLEAARAALLTPAEL